MLLSGGVVDLVRLFREGDRVKDHCQHRRRSRTEPKLPRNGNVSGVERSVLLSFLFRICWISGDFFVPYKHNFLFIREKLTH